MRKEKKNLMQRLGLLGVVSFISYAAAVLFAPLAYPGYDWKRQAVSDLSAVNAPSFMLWNQLNACFGLCGIVCVMMVCVGIQGKLNKPIRTGIYSFAAMNWVSCVGYTMFPLTDSGYADAFQDFVHVYVLTAAVVALSILSLVLIMIGGYRKRFFLSLAIWATAALAGMVAGPIGINAMPIEYFGIFERFSVFAATIFNAVLGVYLFLGKLTEQKVSGAQITEWISGQ